MNAQVWQADHVVSIALAEKLIQMQFSNLEVKKIAYFGAGWDNTAFLVNDQYIFRFPRRKVAVALLEREVKLLPFLAEKLPLKIPKPVFVGEASAFYPCLFSGYKILEGISASELTLDSAARAQNTEALANFLRVLHSIELPSNLLSEAIIENRANPHKLVPKTLEALVMLEEHQYVFGKKLEIYLENFPVSLQDNTRHLIHGDFYPKHILLNIENKVCGVIDWGDAEINHPALDLAIAFQFLPERQHEKFRQIYHLPISEASWELARLRALYSTMTLIHYATDVGDQPLLKDSLASLKLMTESLM